jgi:Uma2 family endonuclease
VYVTPESLPRLSPEEYLVWENQQETRHVLVDGYLYALTGASLRHDEIAMNLASALHVHLSGGLCRVYKSDIKVDVANDFYYPDLVVRCDDNGSSKNQFSISDPKVIVEVLSPSTQRFDRGDKRLAYLQIPTLTDYVLISQDSQYVEHFSADGSLNTFSVDTDLLSIESLQFSIQLSEIYR